MTILVDMDDVLEQLVSAWCEYINEKFGTSASYDDVRDWNMALAFPTLTREQVYSPELDDDFWNIVMPMPGADEAMRKMIADGHEVYVVTASYYQTLKAKLERVLFRYFPYIDWKHVIITSNKSMIRGDVLIDDGPHNFEGERFGKLLFDAGHNRKIDENTIGAVRVHGWKEAYREVCRLSDEYNRQNP